jgi:hypothetical protein
MIEMISNNPGSTLKIEYYFDIIPNYKMDNSTQQFITKYLHIRHTISTQVHPINISHTISTPIRIPIKNNITKQNNITQQNYGIYSIILSILIILIVLFGI